MNIFLYFSITNTIKFGFHNLSNEIDNCTQVLFIPIEVILTSTLSQCNICVEKFSLTIITNHYWLNNSSDPFGVGASICESGKSWIRQSATDSYLPVFILSSNEMLLIIFFVQIAEITEVYLHPAYNYPTFPQLRLRHVSFFTTCGITTNVWLLFVCPNKDTCLNR